MINLKMAIIAAFAVLISSGAQGAPCVQPPNVSFDIKVQEAPLTVAENVTLGDLKAASDRMHLQPAHPVLGFYAGTVGYALGEVIEEVARPESSGCAGFHIDATLVVVDRRIAIANDLAATPCRQKAALRHYRSHAEAASLALHRFASRLPAMLKLAVDPYLQAKQRTPGDVRQYADNALDVALGDFTASLRQLQTGVDTDDEVRRMSATCNRT